ncbi:MAG: hypothetical protein R3293_08650 [Candidatus Promineifilaceae bacterium]|nr:hypothetical protein [Candidatus Promineifilaceae bacterium]
MIRYRVLLLLFSAVLVFSMAGCGSETPTETAAAPESTAVDFEDFEEFSPDNFDRSTHIDNEWLPMKPGTHWIFEGSTVEDGERIPHRIEFTVTDLTKEIAGVNTIVAFVQDFAADELVESEIAFYAQDMKGNVWYFGEYPEEYEDGEVVDAPAWIAGEEGALPGVKMWAQPRLGIDSYAQGWAPEVEWSDRGQIYRMQQQICTPAYCGGDVLIIDEFSQEEPDAFQQKYYAPGIGNVAVGWRGDDASQEELQLVEFTQLETAELSEFNDLALALEDNAYENSEVYAVTAPATAPVIVDSSATVVDDEVLNRFDAANFDNPTVIDNPWLPMPPGRQLILEGHTEEDDGTIIPHRIVWTVTDLVKEINGVETVVAWIEDFAAGELVETEIAFYAQDNDGNVWYFGEYPEEWEAGVFVHAPAWIAGKDGALAGIKMLADPQLDTPSYAQGWAPEVGWSDRGVVQEVDQSTCVAYDCFDEVLIIAEFSEDEPGAIQLKSYARGVGNVQVGWTGDDPNRETLELVGMQDLTDLEVVEVRDDVLALERRALDISRVYSETAPAIPSEQLLKAAKAQDGT